VSVGSNTLNEEYRMALHHKWFFLCSAMKEKKTKFTLEQAMTPQRGSAVIALLFLNIGVRRESGCYSHTQAALPLGK
jgi:hypothetical protein